MLTGKTQRRKKAQCNEGKLAKVDTDGVNQTTGSVETRMCRLSS